MEHRLTSEGWPGHQSNVNGSRHFQLYRVTFKLILAYVFAQMIYLKSQAMTVINTLTVRKITKLIQYLGCNPPVNLTIGAFDSILCIFNVDLAFLSVFNIIVMPHYIEKNLRLSNLSQSELETSD